MPNVKKIAIYGISGVIAIILIVLLIKWLKNKVGDKITEVQQEHVNALEIVTSEVTVTDAQIQQLVKKLKTAFGRWGWGTDEEAVYAVYESLNTRSDVLKLVNKFGTQDGHTLEEWLNHELNAEEIEHLQSILSSKGIIFTI